jgi:hypothetical protein
MDNLIFKLGNDMRKEDVLLESRQHIYILVMTTLETE